MSNSRAALRHALAIVRASSGRETTIASVLELLGALGAAVQLILIGRVLQVLTAPESERVLDDAIAPGLLLLLMLVITRAIATAAGELTRVIAAQVEAHVRRRVAARVAAAPLTDLDNPDFLDPLARARGAVRDAARSFTSNVLGIVRTAATAVAVGAVIWRFSPAVVLLTVIVFALFVLVMLMLGRLRYSLYERQTVERRERNLLQRILTSRATAKTTRLFGLGDVLLPRIDEVNESIIAGVRRVAIRRAALNTAADAVLVVALGLGAVWGFANLDDGSLSLSDAGVIVAGLITLLGRVRTLGAGVGGARTSMLHLADFAEWMDSAPEPNRPPHAGVRAEPRVQHFDRLELRGVSFRYPDEPTDALAPLDLELRAGEVLMVYGPNGAGKSTLAAILTGLLEPTTGAVFVDGREAHTTQLRSMSTAVFQQSERLLLPVEQAIAAGDPAPDDDAIEQALEASGAEQFITWPADRRRRLGRQFSGGVEFSDGQWQRLAIARALYRDAPIVVFDEATSMQDATSRALVMDAAFNLAPHQVAVVITHDHSVIDRPHRRLDLSPVNAPGSATDD